MFKLYKISDGAEVNFTTEEGMMKTLEAFPKKYRLRDNSEIQPDEIIKESEHNEEITNEIPDLVDGGEIKEVDLDEEIKESEEH